ncbi:hypothetical protein [Enterobacter hormaechei]|uniref:hypothetical protein n=1 Tax=Enterobacter hormaechei TaxID=158836 RepID=UPI00223F6B3E|nr:hypothetical protein [Enterobacter hormaechei]
MTTFDSQWASVRAEWPGIGPGLGVALSLDLHPAKRVLSFALFYLFLRFSCMITITLFDEH